MTHLRVKYWFSYIERYPDFTGCLINGNNCKAWFKNGKYHRENSPAVEYPDGSKTWWLNGEEYTEQEHQMIVRQMKLKLLDTAQSTL